MPRPPIPSVRTLVSSATHAGPSSTAPLASPRAKPSTVAVGTAYEEYALSLLNSELHMLLRRVGGKGDGGVDLRGEWWLPKPPRQPPRRAKQTDRAVLEPGEAAEGRVGPIPPLPLPRTSAEIVQPPALTRKGEPSRRKIHPATVWVQCKAAQVTLGPAVVRELDGVLAGRDPTDTLGILVSKSGFSQQAHIAALRAQSAIMLVHLPFDYDTSLASTVSSTPISSATISDISPSSTETTEPIPVLGATYNPAFGRFLALHNLELRRELRGSTPGVGVWYAGSRMARFGPPSLEPSVGRSPNSVVEGAEDEEPKQSRPRGRPRKTASDAPEGSRAVSTTAKPKSGGRPRKTPLPPSDKPKRSSPRKAPQPSPSGDGSPSGTPERPRTLSPDPPIKRRPGRPRKTTEVKAVE